ncbi:hypothetical protein M2163_004718 [Streptomyces sp. SAI-135]|nr:hypothetical protein [Streptomyces sp. SAI-135]
MRIRTTVAAVSGGLVLAALAVPVAQADGGGLHKPTAAERFGVSRAAMSAAADDVELPVVSKVTVNGGKSIVAGTTGVKTFTVSLTASHSAGIEDAYIDLWHGRDRAHVDGVFAPNEQNATCTAVSTTTSNCKLTITVDVTRELYMNSLAGTWHVTAAAIAADEAGTDYWNDFYGTHKLQRLSKLTANAAPEPVKKGKTITVTGKLTRANWETRKYNGLHVPAGAAAVPEEGLRHLHDREDGQDQQQGRPEDHGQGHGRRVLPLELRGHLHHPGRQRRG